MSANPKPVIPIGQRVKLLAERLKKHVNHCYNDNATVEAAINRLETFENVEKTLDKLTLLDLVYEELGQIWSNTDQYMVDLCKIRDELGWLANRLATA